MKDWLKHLVTFFIGIGVGIFLCLFNPIVVEKKDTLIDSDTTQREIVKYYTPLELAKNTIKLDVPKVNTRDLIFIEESSLDTIYQDNVRYVTLQRENYYTKQDDIEIWHSGVSSRIDSLRYTMRETTITDTYKKRDWKHEISIYASAGYCGVPRLPIGAEYTYYPKKWVGFGGKIERDILHKTTGIYATARFRLGW